MNSIRRTLAAACVATLGAVALSAATATAQKGAAPTKGAAAQKMHFEVSFPATAIGKPVTGRVVVMISRVNDREPRLQIGRTGVPFFGRDIEQLKPGEAATID